MDLMSEMKLYRLTAILTALVAPVKAFRRSAYKVNLIRLRVEGRMDAISSKAHVLLSHGFGLIEEGAVDVHEP